MHKVLRICWVIVCLGVVSVLGHLSLSVEGLPFALPRTSPTTACALAAELTVCPAGPPTCEYTSIQAAVDVAAEGDVIKVAAGTYTDVHVRPRRDITTTGVVTQVVYLAKSITLRGGYTTAFTDPPDPDANPAILDAQGRGRVLYITGNISPTIEGLHLTGGNAANLGGACYSELCYSYQDSGGGAYIVSATATVSRCRIHGNTAYYGGGFYLRGSAATLDRNVVTANTTQQYGQGGGLYLHYSPARLTANTIIANTALGSGDGLYLDHSYALLTNNSISSNTGEGVLLYYSPAVLVGNTVSSNAGSGVFIDYSNAVLDANTITSNTVSNSGGGGIYVRDSNVALRTNTIAANSASYGGGVYLSSGDSILDNNLIADNTITGSSYHGSGLYLYGAAQLRHNTIAHNTGGRGEGVYITGWEGYSRVQLYNTILAYQTVGVRVDSNYSVQLEGTLWWANGTDWELPGASTVITGTVNIRGDPGFVNPTGGDYHIQDISPARNAGVYTSLADDVDGEPRPMDFLPDIGMDEIPGPGLQLHQTANSTLVNPGQTITYVLIITATGTAGSNNIVFTDTLPVQQQTTDVISSRGTCVSNADWGGVVRCTLGTMNLGESVRITFTARITTTTPVHLPYQMYNAATVRSSVAANMVDLGVTLHNCHVRLNNDHAEWNSIQAAVDASTWPTDVVKVAGVCTGMNTRGGLRQMVFVDHSVTIRGGYTVGFDELPDPDASPAILDAQGRGRVFYASRGITLTLEGIHVTGGDAHGLKRTEEDKVAGGGLYAVGARVILSHCFVLDNVSGAPDDYSGGVCLDSSTAVITASTFVSNTGSALDVYYGDVTMTASVVTSNTYGLILILSSATLTANTIYANEGLGVLLLISPASLISNTIAGNLFGVDSTESPATLIANVVVSNTEGGLRFSGGDSTLTANVIASNTAAQGGGVYIANGKLTLNANTIVSNTAGSGGGLYAYYSDVALIDNTIMSNTAQRDGGGMWIYEGYSMLADNTISGNTAQNGGGVYGYGSDDWVGNTISGNRAEYYGGGLVLFHTSTFDNNVVSNNGLASTGYGSGMYGGGNLRLRHNTFARNTGGDGSGLHLTNDSTLAMTNTIMVSHTVGITVAAGSTATLEATLWGNDVDWGGSGAVITGASGNIWGDPAFVNPDGWDYHIGPASAARDAGVDAGLESDIDGYPRPAGKGFDLGADEYPGPVLMLHATAQPAILNPGQTVTYTFWVTGAGTLATGHTTLYGVLPAEQRSIVVMADHGACAIRPGWGGGTVCDLGAMAPGDIARVILTAQTTSDLPSVLPWPIRNTIWVTNSGTARSTYVDVIVQDCHVRLNADPTEYTVIQDAIDASVTPTDVVLVAGVCAGVNDRGGLRQQVYLTKTLTIQGGWNRSFTQRNTEVYLTTLDALRRGRVLYLSGGISPTIEGLRVTGGDASGLGTSVGYYDVGRGGGGYIAAAALVSGCMISGNAASNGGGLYLYSSSTTLNGNIVIANTARYNGGGIYLDSSSAALIANMIASNTAKYNGGGMYLSSSPAVLTANTVTFNTAQYGGGGVYLSSSPAVLTANTVTFNTAQYDDGGGMLLSSSPAVLTANTIAANSARYSGGGIYMSSSPAKLEANIVTDNETQYAGGTTYGGGGLYLSSSAATLTNTVVISNRAASKGGGLYIYSSFPKLLHTTIAHNLGGDSSGIYVAGSSSMPSTVALTNTILVNQATGIYVVSRHTARMESTLWYGNTSNWSGTVYHANDYTGNPVFAFDGYHLTASSAAINKGVNAGVASDIDGQARPEGAAPDLGADEYVCVSVSSVTVSGPTSGIIDLPYQFIATASPEKATLPINYTWQATDQSPVSHVGGWSDSAAFTWSMTGTKHITVTVSNSGGLAIGNYAITITIPAWLRYVAPGGVDAGNDCLDSAAPCATVQHAVDAAGPGDEVHVAVGDYTGVSARAGITQAVYITKTISIRGGYAPSFIEPPNPDVNPTVLNANGQGRVFYIAGKAVTLEGLHITGGAATGMGGTSADNGGGVYAATATLVISGCRLSGNTAGQGGGVYLDNSQGKLNNNTFVFNTASTNGGGVYLYQSPIKLEANVIHSNSANNAGGGAVLDNSMAVLGANTILSNTARWGGGVYLLSSGAVFVNTLIANNHASSRGDGVYVYNSSPHMVHTTLARNTGGDGSGIYVTGDSIVPGTPLMTNTILVSHTIGINVTAGYTAGLEATLWGNDADWGGSGAILAGARNYWGDAVFADLGLGDYHIGVGSAAIDRGVAVQVVTDIDNEFRPRSDTGIPDLGADEYWGWAPLTASRSITGASSYSFGDTCATLLFEPGMTGTLDMVTVTLVYTYPTVQRSYHPLPRWYNIQGNVDSGFTATLSLCYNEADLVVAGIQSSLEGDLSLYRYDVASSRWVPYVSTVDVDANIITTTITGLSVWAIGAPGHEPTVAILRSTSVAHDEVYWHRILAAVLCVATVCLLGRRWMRCFQAKG